MAEWVLAIILFALIFLLVLSADIFVKKRLFSPEAGRKYVHIGVGTLILLTPLMFKGPKYLIILSVVFTFINGMGLILDKFKGMHGVERETLGTVLYPIAVLIIASLFFKDLPVFYLSLIPLFYGDAFASIVGQKYPYRILEIDDFRKSVGGFIAMVVSTLILSLLVLFILRRAHLIPIVIFSSILAGVVELSFSGGFDNLIVPLIVAFFLYVAPSIKLGLILIYFLLSLIISTSAYRLGALTIDGALYTFGLGVGLLILGGFKWILPILTFFITSSALTKLAKKRATIKGGERRNYRQVLANGGVGLILAVLNYFIRDEILFIAYLTSLAVVNADTWSTEIGAFSKKDPVLIVGGKKVPKGSSGGVTPLGVLAGFLGSAVIALFVILYDLPTILFFTVLLLGVLGDLLDSLLGATIEVQYKCIKCGGIFDVDFHCGEKLQYIRGVKWFGNNWVNFSSSLMGALLAIIIGKLF